MIEAAKRLNLTTQDPGDAGSGTAARADAVSADGEDDKKAGVEDAKDEKSTESASPLGDISEKLPDIVSVMKMFGTGQKGGKPIHRDDKRIKLLLALRPYLSDHRRDVVDYIIRMNNLGELFKNIF